MDDNEKLQTNQQSNSSIQGSIQPEEVAPEVSHPEDIAGNLSQNFPRDVPVYEEKHSHIGVILGAFIFFIFVFGLIYWFFIRNFLSPQEPNSGPQSTEKVTLKYWGLWEDKIVYTPLFEAYQKANPLVTIQYERMEPEQYRERLLARSKTGNGPDLFRFHNTWIPEIKDVISALPADVMTNEMFESTFYPIHQKDLKIGTAYYGIPLMVDGLILAYNQELLNQAGFVNPPSQWIGSGDDVFSQVSKLTVKDPSGTIVTSGMAIGTASNIEHFGEIYGVLLLLNGGDLKDIASKEAGEALALYRKFSEDGHWDDTLPNSIPAFIQGKVAMIFVPSWQILAIKKENPNLVIKTAPIPKGLDGAAASTSSYWVEGVNKYSKHQAESWKLLKYLSEKESLIKLFENQSKVRLFGTAYPRKDMAELLRSHDILGAVITQAESNTFISLPLADRTHDGGLNDEILKYIENAVNSTVTGTDYTSALGSVAAGINSVLKRYSIE